MSYRHSPPTTTCHAPAPPTLHQVARDIDVLRHDRLVFVLAEKLTTEVSFEELFIIRCEALDLTVWGPTLTAAEEALAFSFHALYQNYYLADDVPWPPTPGSSRPGCTR